MRVLTAIEQMFIEKTILPVVATGRDGSFRPVGTCWIFAFSTDGKHALAFSAAHVFDEVVRSEGRHQRAAASMPDILRPQRSTPVTLAHTKLNAVYRSGPNQLDFVEILQVSRDGLFDLAVCHLAFPVDADTSTRFEKKLAVHTGPVAVGTGLSVAGYAGMEATEYAVDNERGVSTARLHKRLTFEHGTCAAYHTQKGPRGPTGPCFEINVKTAHGMSGGPVLHKGYGDLIVGCGVVSRGTSFGGDESTMAAALWPAYSFELSSLVHDGHAATLIELAASGSIDDRSNGPCHFRRIGNLGIDWV